MSDYTEGNYQEHYGADDIPEDADVIRELETENAEALVRAAFMEALIKHGEQLGPEDREALWQGSTVKRTLDGG